MPIMENREELAQSNLFATWLEAAPFQEYRGWYVRASQDEAGWTWDLIEPTSRGGGWFESATVYPTKSKAVLAARRLVIQNTVCWEITQFLQELCASQAITLEEYRSLTTHLQNTEAMSLHSN